MSSWHKKQVQREKERKREFVPLRVPKVQKEPKKPKKLHTRDISSLTYEEQEDVD